MHEWDPESLFEKSKVYVDRAFNEDRDGPWFGLWMTFALELLSRSVLAARHPSLLANPNEPENILYACGIGRPNAPRSVGAKAVFRRCQMLVDEFTKHEFDACMSLIERRNQELHSAGVGFADFPNSAWLRDYYRTVVILLTHLGHELEDFLPMPELEGANRMIEQMSDELLGQIHRKRNEAQILLNLLSDDELQDKREKIKDTVVKLAKRDDAKLHKCPICESNGLLSGEIVSVGDPNLGVDARNIIVEQHVLPTSFKCGICDLNLNSYQELDHMGLGGQFVKRRVYDPLEFHGIDLEHFATHGGYVHVSELEQHGMFDEWEYDNE